MIERLKKLFRMQTEIEIIEGEICNLLDDMTHWETGFTTAEVDLRMDELEQKLKSLLNR